MKIITIKSNIYILKKKTLKCFSFLSSFHQFNNQQNSLPNAFGLGNISNYEFPQNYHNADYVQNFYIKNDDLPYNENECKQFSNKDNFPKLPYHNLENTNHYSLNQIKGENEINEDNEKKPKQNDEENIQRKHSEDFNKNTYRNKETYNEKIKKLMDKKLGENL